MLLTEVVTQPAAGAEYRQMLELAASAAPFTAIDVAVAYATVGGTRCLPLAFTGRLPARWLVGVDWCRSDPDALDYLDGRTGANVRVPGGGQLVGRKDCVPTRPFHAKSYLLTGPHVRGLLTGSANLSISGMTRGTEHGVLTVVSRPRTKVELRLWASLERVNTWFESSWNSASAWSQIKDAYGARHEAARKARSVLATDDDAAPPSVTDVGRLTPEDLRVIRAASNMWVEIDYVTPNRGRGRPGNQIDMQAMTRVFFGLPATDVPRNSTLASILLAYQGTTFDASLRYGNNHMEKINLPIPGAGGPADYTGKTLLFSRLSDGDVMRYRVSLGNQRQTGRWAARSRAARGLFSMRSGRRWGVF